MKKIKQIVQLDSYFSPECEVCTLEADASVLTSASIGDWVNDGDDIG